MTRHLSLLGLLLGCSGAPPTRPADYAGPFADTADSGAPLDTRDTAQPVDTADTAEPVDTGLPRASLSGVVTDESGATLVHVQVQLCALKCRVERTDDLGRFEFPDVEATTHAVHVDGEETLAGAVFAVTLEADEAGHVAVTLPPIAPVLIPEESVEIEIGEGIWLTVRADALGADSAGAARVPESDHALLAVEDDLAAAWYLAPRVESAESMTLRVDTSLAGATARMMDLSDPAWHDLGPVAADGTLTVSALCTLALTR